MPLPASVAAAVASHRAAAQVGQLRPGWMTEHFSPAAAWSARASQRQPVRACVAMGANLGDAVGTLASACAWLSELPATTVHAVSGLYRTAPWQTQGPDFFNAVAAVDTRLTAPDLLHALLALELRAGRERPYRYAPRTLDLDLLLFGSACVDSVVLTVPHPRMWQRAFVVVPLSEVAPACVSTQALRAVQGQVIERLPGGWPVEGVTWGPQAG